MRLTAEQSRSSIVASLSVRSLVPQVPRRQLARAERVLLRFCLLATTVALLFIASLPAHAVPPLIQYQGLLTDTLGVPVSGSFDVTFSLHSGPTGGDSLWGEVHPAVVLDGGVFSVLLGGATPVEGMPTLLFDGGDLWLQTKLGTTAPFPRVRIVSVGYAFRAAEADTANFARSSPAADAWSAQDSVVWLSRDAKLGIGTANPLYAVDIQLNVDEQNVGPGECAAGFRYATLNDVGDITSEFRISESGGYPVLSLTNLHCGGSAELVNTTGGWNWSSSLQFKGPIAVNFDETQATLAYGFEAFGSQRTHGLLSADVVSIGADTTISESDYALEVNGNVRVIGTITSDGGAFVRSGQSDAIAYLVVQDAEGQEPLKARGRNIESVVYNDAEGQYEIKITGVTFNWAEYPAFATILGAGASRSPATIELQHGEAGAGNAGKMLVSIRNDSGSAVRGAFSVAVHAALPLLSVGK